MSFLILQPKTLEKLLHVASGLPGFVEDFQDEIRIELAERYYNLLIQHIEKQDLNWPPLTEDYLEYKRRNDLDLRSWIASGELKSSIEVIGPTDDGEYYVGISGDKIHKSGIRTSLLAMIHEYGRLDHSIPPRPVFRPTFWEFRGMILVLAGRKVSEISSRYWGNTLRTL